MLVFRGVPTTQEEQTSKQGHKSAFFHFQYLTAFVASASYHMKHESIPLIHFLKTPFKGV